MNRAIFSKKLDAALEALWTKLANVGLSGFALKNS